jgi:hypothetical protein
MKDFINSVLTELKSNPETRNNSLVKLVVESADKSISHGDSIETIYEGVKAGLIDINKHVESKSVKSVLDQFKKMEYKPESKLKHFAKMANLSGKLKAIKESHAYSNPIISHKVNQYEMKLKGGIPEFQLYPAFINDFNQHSIEESVNKAVIEVSNTVDSNIDKFEILNVIESMKGMNSEVYSSVIEGLTEMLVNNTYTSDIINLKFGKLGLSNVNNLVHTLKIHEDRKNGTFTLGAGNGLTSVRNEICPAIKSARKSVLTFIDGRFIRITESNKLNGSEDEVHVKGGGFSVSTIKPNWVSNKFPDFYKLCESYAKLGFKSFDGGVESTVSPKFKVEFRLNESRNLDLYVNENKVDSSNQANLTATLFGLGQDIQESVKTVILNSNSLLNLEFIKTVTNETTMSESTVYQLGGNYFLCKKPNAAERIWESVDANTLYEHFATNFKYDISPIVGDKINESIILNNQVQDRKEEILKNISKLEESIAKLNDTIHSKDTDSHRISDLEELKESIENSIEKLKEEYVNVDLIRKSVNEQWNWLTSAYKSAAEMVLGKENTEKLIQTAKDGANWYIDTAKKVWKEWGNQVIDYNTNWETFKKQNKKVLDIIIKSHPLYGSTEAEKILKELWNAGKKQQGKGAVKAGAAAGAKAAKSVNEKKKWDDVTGDGKFTKADVLKLRGVKLDEKEISKKDKYCQKEFGCDYKDCTKKQKEQCDKNC